MVMAFRDHGIYLHIVHPVSQSVMLNPGSVNPNLIRYGDIDNNGTITHDLSTESNATTLASEVKEKLFYKPSKFSSVREFIYNYILIGHRYSYNDSNGRSGIAWSTLEPYTLIFVASDIFTDKRGQSGTIMHELGHTLALGHGGPYESKDSDGVWQEYILYNDSDDHYNYERKFKPHYLSLMNYNYQSGYIYDAEGNDILDYQSCVPLNRILDEDNLNETKNFLSSLTCSGTQVSKIENKYYWPVLSSIEEKWDTIESTDDRINWNNSLFDIEDIVKVNINPNYDGNYTRLCAL